MNEDAQLLRSPAISSSHNNHTSDSHEHEHEHITPHTSNSYTDTYPQNWKYSFDAFYSTAMPVSITIFIASLSAVFLSNDQDSNIAYYKISDDDTSITTHTHAYESIINAVIIITTICLFTFLVVYLIWLGYSKLIVGYTMFSSGLLLAFEGSLYLYTIIVKLDIPVDIFSFVFIIYNFAVVGVYAIFYHDSVSPIITQGYVICVSVLLAWQFSRLDAWTTWILLLLLTVYDALAVLTPCGPLSILVNLMHDRPNDELPGLLYEAKINTDHDVVENHHYSVRSPLQRDRHNQHVVTDNRSHNHDVDEHAPLASHHIHIQASDEVEDDNDGDRTTIRLGLGDFVFYSVLLSRAAMSGFTTFITSYLFILTGLYMTIWLLAVYKQAVPALPLSIILGVSVYFTTKYCVISYADAMIQELIIL